MKHVRLKFAGAFGLMLCQMLCTSHALTSRLWGGRVTPARPQILGTVLPESVKLALLGIIFLAASSVARHKSSDSKVNINAPHSMSVVAPGMLKPNYHTATNAALNAANRVHTPRGST